MNVSATIGEEFNRLGDILDSALPLLEQGRRPWIVRAASWLAGMVI